MAEAHERARKRFSRKELEELSGEVLPQRAATSLIDPHLATRLATGLAAAAIHSHDVAAPADTPDVDAEDVAETDEP